MNDLNELQFFAYVARYGSFTVAASRLGVPKSTVSRGVAKLELRLGLRLLDRTTRRVALTEAGRLYLTHCQRALDEAEHAEMLVNALREEPKGRLRVGMSVTFARAYLAPIIGELLCRHPDLQLHLDLKNPRSEAVVTDLDIVIRAGPVEDSELNVRFIGRVPAGIYASPKYVERHGAPDTPASLRDHSCAMYADYGSGTSWRMRRGSEVVDITPPARVAVTDPMLHLQLAVDHACVVRIGWPLARPEVEAGRLVRLLPEWEPDAIELYALYASRVEMSPLVRVFLDYLKEKISLNLDVAVPHS